MPMEDVTIPPGADYTRGKKALTTIAAELDKDASKASDATKVKMMAVGVRELAKSTK